MNAPSLHRSLSIPPERSSSDESSAASTSGGTFDESPAASGSPGVDSRSWSALFSPSMMGQRLRLNRPVTLTLNTKDREAKAGEGGRGALEPLLVHAML